MHLISSADRGLSTDIPFLSNVAAVLKDIGISFYFY